MVILSETGIDGIDVKTVGTYCLMHCFADVVRGNVDVIFLPCLVRVHAAF